MLSQAHVILIFAPVRHLSASRSQRIRFLAKNLALTKQSTAAIKTAYTILYNEKKNSVIQRYICEVVRFAMLECLQFQENKLLLLQQQKQMEEMQFQSKVMLEEQNRQAQITANSAAEKALKKAEEQKRKMTPPAKPGN